MTDYTKFSEEELRAMRGELTQATERTWEDAPGEYRQHRDAATAIDVERSHRASRPKNGFISDNAWSD